MSPLGTAVVVCLTAGSALLGVLYMAMAASLQRRELAVAAVVFALLAAVGCVGLVGS